MRSIILPTQTFRLPAEAWLRNCIQRVLSELASPLSACSDSAMPVPWRMLQRNTSGRVMLQHVGTEPLHRVTITLAGRGLLGLSPPRRVLPGDCVRIEARGVTDETGAALYADTVAVVRWGTADGREWLWPITW